MLGTFVSKTIPRSAKAVCSCTILCLALKTVNCTRRSLWDRLFGQGFDSPHLHQNNIIRTFCRLVMGSDLLFLLRKLKTGSFVSILDTMLAEQPSAQGVLRVYLKTPNAPGQRAFLRCAASFFLEIRQYSCEKMSCATQKSLAAGHIMSFQIHPTVKWVSVYEFAENF